MRLSVARLLVSEAAVSEDPEIQIGSHPFLVMTYIAMISEKRLDDFVERELLL